MRNAYGPNCNQAFTLDEDVILSVECPAVGRAGYAYKNGAKLAAPNVPPLLRTRNLWTIGRTVAGYYYFTGRIAEILIYARHLTSTERHLIEAYLSTKYGIAVVAQ